MRARKQARWTPENAKDFVLKSKLTQTPSLRRGSPDLTQLKSQQKVAALSILYRGQVWVECFPKDSEPRRELHQGKDASQPQLDASNCRIAKLLRRKTWPRLTFAASLRQPRRVWVRQKNLGVASLQNFCGSTSNSSSSSQPPVQCLNYSRPCWNRAYLSVLTDNSAHCSHICFATAKHSLACSNPARSFSWSKSWPSEREWETHWSRLLIMKWSCGAWWKWALTRLICCWVPNEKLSFVLAASNDWPQHDQCIMQLIQSLVLCNLSTEVVRVRNHSCPFHTHTSVISGMQVGKMPSMTADIGMPWPRKRVLSTFAISNVLRPKTGLCWLLPLCQTAQCWRNHRKQRSIFSDVESRFESLTICSSLAWDSWRLWLCDVSPSRRVWPALRLRVGVSRACVNTTYGQTPHHPWHHTGPWLSSSSFVATPRSKTGAFIVHEFSCSWYQTRCCLRVHGRLLKRSCLGSNELMAQENTAVHQNRTDSTLHNLSGRLRRPRCSTRRIPVEGTRVVEAECSHSAIEMVGGSPVLPLFGWTGSWGFLTSRAFLVAESQILRSNDGEVITQLGWWSSAASKWAIGWTAHHGGACGKGQWLLAYSPGVNRAA